MYSVPRAVDHPMPFTPIALIFLRRLLAAVALAGALCAPAVAANNSVTGEKKVNEFQTAAPYAILLDGGTGATMFEKAADVAVPPSSLAKLMTAELVFKALTEGKIKEDDEYIVSENAWRR